MEQSPANPLVRLAAEHAYEGHALATIEIDGQPAWLAGQVSGALEYSRSDVLGTNITGSWSEELAEGTDFRVLRGEELALLKSAAPGLVSANAPSAMVLTESGVHLVALLSRQPKARTLRRWLASEVLPSIRKTGSYRPPSPLAARDGTEGLVALARDLVARGDALDEIHRLVATLASAQPRIAIGAPRGGRSGYRLNPSPEVLARLGTIARLPGAYGLHSSEHMLLTAIYITAERDASGRLVSRATMGELGAMVGWKGRKSPQRYLGALVSAGLVEVVATRHSSNLFILKEA